MIDDPIGYWKLNDTGSSITDYSGNGITGTATGTTNTSGVGVTTKSFNGTTDFIDLGTPASLQFFTPTVFTTTAWIYSTAMQTGCVISYGDNAWAMYFQWSGDPHYFLAAAVPNVANGNENDITHIELNTWYHVAIRWPISASVNIDYFINGKKVFTSTSNAPNLHPISYANNLCIGKTITGGLPFAGKLQEVRVYNRGLTDDEIQAIYLLHAFHFQNKGIRPRPFAPAIAR